ncbi:hypothetical protein EAE96_005898 [Botrytis aclada]|nr:hypothetical protein EAE96_005898 [Botrytis aclada]
MRWRDFFRGKKKNTSHENHASHTPKPSKSNNTVTTYGSDVSNDGYSKGRPQDVQNAKRAHPPPKSEYRIKNSSHANQVDKSSYSVKDRIEYIEHYIDHWNNYNPHKDPIKIDIIILEGLLDINQNLTEPRSDSEIKFICTPGKLWDDKLYPQKLHRACEKLEWHTNDQWCPHTLHSGVRKRLFEAMDKDRWVYKSDMEGLIIRAPPPDYRICQRIDRLRGWESQHKKYKSELNAIVKDIQIYINSNKKKLEAKRSKSGRSIMTPRDLVKEWQKEYHFDFSNVLQSLKNDGVERSKLCEHSGTRIHESHRVNGAHDSADSLPNTGRRAPSKSKRHKSSHHGSGSDTSISTSTRPRQVYQKYDSAISLSGASKQAPSNSRALPKSRAPKPSGYVSDSDMSIPPRRPTQNALQPSTQRKPQAKSSHKNLAKTAPHTRPSITIHSSSERRERSPSKSPHRNPPRRSPRTPRTPVGKHVYQNSGNSLLPPSSHSSNPDLQRSPARPGSGGREMTQKKIHGDVLDPSIIQSQPHSRPHVNDNVARPRINNPDLFNNNNNYSRQQQHLNSQLQSPYVIRRNENLRPPNEVVSPVDQEYLPPEDLTPEERAEWHRKGAERLRMEDWNLLNRYSS